MTISQGIQQAMRSPFPYETIDIKRDVQLSIGVKDRVCYITFRATVSFKDWSYNFLFFKKPYKRMKQIFFMHRGMAIVYNTCRHKIHTFLEKNQKDFDAIRIAGFSQGGGYTYACTEDIQYLIDETNLFNKEMRLCAVALAPLKTFSAFGNKLLQERLRNLVILVHGNDLVFKLPFFWMFFKHYGKVSTKGRTHILGIAHPSSIYDHAPQAYRNFEDDSRVETKENNPYIKLANKIYLGIYSTISILIITGVLLWLR